VTIAVAVVAVADATVAPAARATGIASGASDRRDKGGLWAALSPNSRRLVTEAVVIAALIGLTGFLVYHFTTHTIRNQRPLGGANVNVSSSTADQTQAAFAIDPTRPSHLFGASNDSGRETLDVYESADRGKTWRRTDGPVVAGGSCAHGAPRVAADAHGREYLAFLAATFCGDALTPYLVVTSRAGPGEKWGRLVRVAPPAWKFGFDDAPAFAVDQRSGRAYLVWTRGVSKRVATIVISASTDGGRTWSPPAAVWPDLVRPHRATIAVARNGDVYVAGIDAKVGLWITRSTDGGRIFSAPRAAAPLLANPAGGCALTAGDPLPQELRACEGPDPTVSIGKDRVFVVYSDVGSNQTPDVYAAALGLDLKPLFRVPVQPPDRGKTQQFAPTSAVDPTTGTLWACWYDTTFDPHARRAWFTCAASREGRTWSPPERAASDPTPTVVVYSGLGRGGLGPALAAQNGVAHPFWADGRVIENELDIFTASLSEAAARAVKP
jgi:hypothetical protein